jgi:hypothetical protein
MQCPRHQFTGSDGWEKVPGTIDYSGLYRTSLKERLQIRGPHKDKASIPVRTIELNRLRGKSTITV